MKGFRKKYNDKNGHDNYYKEIKNLQLNYSNPHYNKFTYIIDKIIKWLPENISIEKLQNSNYPIIDLAAGSGQITKLLQKYNIKNIIGIEPYLYEQYINSTQKIVYPNTFNDIINGIISFEKIPLIFISYALHLCENADILLEKIRNWTNYLCVITPIGMSLTNANWSLYYKFKFSGIKIYFYKNMTMTIEHS